jgi:excisionase family DNA binding protein
MESQSKRLDERIVRLEQQVGQLPVDPERLYTIGEVADRLRCGKTNVYDLVDGRALAVIRVGAGKGGFRVRGSDLLAFLDSRKSGGPKPEFAFKNLRIS